MEKTEFQEGLEDVSGGCAKIGCALMLIPILIVLLFMMFGLL